jgi:predicted MFS family arabinose efflux permease
VIVLSVWMLTVATALAGTSHTLRQLIVWRFVQGVATPGIFASTVAYVHEVWPPTHAGRATAAYMTGTIIGGFVGRAVSGIVAADATWQMAFVALAVMTGAVAIALTLRLPAETDAGLKFRNPGRAAHAAGRGGIGHLFRNRRLLATCGVGFSVLFTQVAMFTYVTFHLAAAPYLLNSVALGWLFVVYLVGAVVTPFAGHWIDRYGHRTGIASAMAIGGAGALLTLAPWLPAIVAGLALCATGVFTAQATTSSYIGAVTPSDRALAVGMYSTFYYAGGSAGGALPSLVWTNGGWTACVLLVVVIQLAGVVIAMTQWSEASRGEPALEAGG